MFSSLQEVQFSEIQVKKINQIQPLGLMKTFKITNSAKNLISLNDSSLGNYKFDGEIEEFNLKGYLRLNYGKRLIEGEFTSLFDCEMANV